jgi:hypothetical protein
MNECKASNIPIKVSFNCFTNSDSPFVNVVLYIKLVGSLIDLINITIDISFTIRLIVQFIIYVKATDCPIYNLRESN